MARLENFAKNDINHFADAKAACGNAVRGNRRDAGTVGGKDLDEWEDAAVTAILDDDRETFLTAVANMKTICGVEVRSEPGRAQ